MAGNVTTDIFPTVHSMPFSGNESNVFTSVNGTNTTVKPTYGSEGISTNLAILIYSANGIFVMVGICGNVFVCYVIGQGRRMYTVANLFLMNLAVADSCILAISYPLWIMMSRYVKWPLGAIMCKILPSISDSFYGVSLGSITTISIYRYRMILFPLHTHMTFFQAKLIILSIWIVSLLTISAPLYPIIQYNQQFKVCQASWMSMPFPIYFNVYQWMMLLIWYVIPLGVILYTYIRIRVHLKHEMQYKWLNGHSNAKTNGVNGHSNTTNNNLQPVSGHVLGIKRALKLLAPVVVVFTLFMFPWNLGRLLSVLNLPTLHHMYILEYVGATLLFANSAINAFIYYFMSREFREEFKQRFRVVRKFFQFGHTGHFTVQRKYSMSLKTRIELLSVARAGTRRYREVVERLTVV